MSATDVNPTGLCDRLGLEHDMELYATNREYHTYICMRCDGNRIDVPKDYDPKEVFGEEMAE